jgi:hypothetical protein
MHQHLMFFSVWIGPNEGFPTSAIGVDPQHPVRQSNFGECRLPTAAGTIPVVQFTVDGGADGPDYHVVTYWEVRPHVYLRAMGVGPDSSVLATFVAALATIRVLQ